LELKFISKELLAEVRISLLEFEAVKDLKYSFTYFGLSTIWIPVYDNHKSFGISLKDEVAN
jgi:hypothetical protein